MTEIPSMPTRFRAVLNRIAEERGVGPRELVGKTRFSAFVGEVRDEVFYEFRRTTLPTGTPPSYPMIGRWMNRHHTSVIQGERRHLTRQSAATTQPAEPRDNPAPVLPPT